MIGELIYGLCMLLSLAIAVMLWRQHRRLPARLTFWAAICFTGLSLSNLVLILDKLVYPQFDMSIVRHVISLVSIGALLFGLVWEDD